MTSAAPIKELRCEVTIELVTALHIGAGEPTIESDADVVRDFNGLPAIPGSSLQGVMRSVFEARFGRCRARKLFGYAGTRDDQEDQGRGSRLWVGWGSVHNAQDKPQRGRIKRVDILEDDVLRDALTPMLRDHVRINEKGAAADTGKFDELVVSPGHRFTFAMRLRTATGDEHASDSDWADLLSILNDPALRLGGKTRRGLGAIVVRRIERAVDASVQSGQAPGQHPEPVVALQAEFEPLSYWMFGGGSSEDSDSAPVTGTRVSWSEEKGASGQRGKPEAVWIVPGSAVKGALRHRTCFHLCRRLGLYLDSPDAGEAREDLEFKIEIALESLFGTEDADRTRRGVVLIDDTYLPIGSSAGVQRHVKIDPLSGGAAEHLLYDDAPLQGGGTTLPISLTVLPETEEFEVPAPSSDALEALKAAWADLGAGRLGLGAHSGRGYGFFKNISGGSDDGRVANS